MDIITAAETAVRALNAAGVPADTNTDRLQAPCAWVTHERLSIEYLDGAADLRLMVYLIAPANGYEHEIETLQDLLTRALTTLTPDGDIELDAALQTSAGLLPAFRFPLIMKAS